MTGADAASDQPSSSEPPWTVWLVAADGLSDLDRSLRLALADRRGRLAESATDGADAVIGVGNATRALEAATSDRRVRSVVLIDADVSPTALDDIAELRDTAILSVIDPARRERIVAAVDGHLASAHPDSDLIVEPLTPDGLAEAIVGWLERRAAAMTVVGEVTVRTPDGWVLGADLHRPAGTPPTSGWPAVVLMHSGRSDRTVFDRLARLLARAGVVALALDWRGRGTSTNQGHFVDFTSEQQANVRVDVTAAYDHLAGRSDVDARRLGVLGIAHGAGYAADGALVDDRTRAITMMTAYHVADDAQRAALASGRIAAMFVTCEPHVATTRAMRELFEITAAKGSRFVVYPEGVLGYQLFDLHPDLEPTIAAWFAEVLS